jgi:hypothetical protein
MKKNIIIAPLALMMVLGVGVLAQPAYGRGGDDTTVEREMENEQSETSNSGSLQNFEQNKEREQRIADQREKMIKARDEAKASKETRVLNAKQKTCQSREAEIKAVLVKISTRASNHIAVFNKIAERTEAFYAEKGNVLENYDALVAEVSTKKAAAEAAVASLTSIANVFTCDVDNPQASVQAVRDALHAKRDAMKAYKTAVKNLIVGVKSVQSTTTPTDDTKENQ